MYKFMIGMIGAGTLVVGAWLILTKTRITHQEKMKQLIAYDYAHRGLHDLSMGVPENSMAAFARAVQHGYGIELDVHLTRDGRLAVIHDATLNRVCGVNGVVEKLTFRELQQYELCGTTEKIPELKQVLDLVAGAVPLIIEIKPEHENEGVLCERISEVLEHYTGKFCLESFDPRVLFWFRRHRPDWLRGQLTEYFARHGNKTIHPAADFVLHHVMFNLFTRPDFLAYNTKDRRCLTLRMCRKLFHAAEADWTIRDREQFDLVKADGAMTIFENFLP
ncbi:MAG: glycerophosphodiester phosphodiesterase family protein [Lachnospiraceae bacterium]|nr:glycerophosphodiester phosphodiesterase family protein [Lachnospiraceae bacterium]